MQLEFATEPLAQLAVDALIVGVSEGDMAGSVPGAWPELAAALAALPMDEPFSGKEGDVAVLYPVAGGVPRRVVVTGWGKGQPTIEGWRCALANGFDAVRGRVRRVGFTPPAGL